MVAPASTLTTADMDIISQSSDSDTDVLSLSEQQLTRHLYKRLGGIQPVTVDAKVFYNLFIMRSIVITNTNL